MVITIREVKDKTLWENFVLQEAPTAFFQSWYWGEIYQARLNRVWRFGVYEGTTLVGLFQVVRVDAKRGRFLHVRHGPVVATPRRTIWRSTLEFLKELARHERAWFIRVSPQLADTSQNQRLFSSLGLRPSPIHAMDGELCWVLDLTPSEEEILANMRKTTRYEIKHGLASGIEIISAFDSSLMPEFLDLYAQTSKRHGFVPHQELDEEFKTFSTEGKAVLYLGRYKGVPLAGAIIVDYGDRVIYRHGASIPSKMPVSHLLQWTAIRQAKKRGMKVYNFWGIAPDDKPNHPWRGITVFKQGFGGREVSLIHAQDLPVSPWYAIPWSIEMLRRWQRGY